MNSLENNATVAVENVPVGTPKKKKKGKINPLMALVFVVLALYTLSFVFILGWGFITTFKSGVDDYPTNAFGLPNFELLSGPNKSEYSIMDVFGHNFIKAICLFGSLKDAPPRSYFSDIFGLIEKPGQELTLGFLLTNTFVYAILGAFVYAFVSMTVAYMCSKYRYKFSTIIYFVNVTIMIIPIVGAQPATIDMLQSLGMYDSYWGMIFQKINFSGMYFLVFFAFYSGLSDAYTEAAEIDGASQISIFFNIILPLSAKMLGTIFLLYFITLWNDYQTPLLYYPTHPTLAYALFTAFHESQGVIYNGVMQKGPEWVGTPVKIAASMVFVIPIVILFCVFSDKIMGDVSLGGVKE